MGLLFYFFTFMLLLPLNLAVADNFTFVHPLCNNDERFALLQFKESLTINVSASKNPYAYPKVASWGLNTECCSWDGVTCNEHTGHVIKINLSSSCLYGSINSSSSLFHLVHLEWLSLADNDFNGSQIPSGFINLSELSYLELSASGFSGQIPAEILELSQLAFLDVCSNDERLELHKPGLESLAEKLKHLKLLCLSEVKISSPVPRILANLSSLSYLFMRKCDLRGKFPTEIFHLPNLHVLSIRHNWYLSGYLPEFEKSNPLEALLLEETGFYGPIPSSIGYLTKLVYLDLSFTAFTGTIPSSLWNLTKIVILDLSYSHFTGELPTSIGNLGSLEELNIALCNFFGQIPSSLINLTQLNYLDVSYNNFQVQNSSSLSCMTKTSKLIGLDLSGIKLVGEVPFSMMNLTQLSILYMMDNRLSGSIPDWLMNLNQLTVLMLGSNQLTGSIPSEIRNLTQLERLDLSSNQLQGSIPSSIFELNNLLHLVLDSNNLSGTVDLDMLLLKLKSLSWLILPSNNLSLLIKPNVNTTQQQFHSIGFGSCKLGEFPNFLRNQHRSIGLDLSSNNIQGQIPGWFLNISIDTLSSVNLSHNHLTGFEQHHVVLPWIDLVCLDLRFNKLQGPLPIPSVSTIFYLVSNNQLIVEILHWICSLNSLYALDLSYNNLSGMLPQCLGSFSYDLSILQLQSNQFHGTIPQIFLKGTNLKMIDLSSNLLEGKVPRSLANCQRLEFLNLADNHITDFFPFWLGALPELKVFILRSNRFQGLIKEPQSDFEFPKLRIIDISYNRFTGEFPSKYFECWNTMKVVNRNQLTYMQFELVPLHI